MSNAYAVCNLNGCGERIETSSGVPDPGDAMEFRLHAEDDAIRTHLAQHSVGELLATYPNLPGDRKVVARAPRWKVVIPAGTLKGIAEADARRIAAEHDGTIWRSTVTLYSDGSELLGPWARVSDGA